MRVKDSVGAHGENVAVAHLVQDGFEVIDRNWRCSAGEVDIVAVDAGTVVVVEVKTRRGFGFGTGLEAVTRDKGARLRRLALHYLEASGRSGWPLRIDVVAVHYVDGDVHVEHVRGAF